MSRNTFLKTIAYFTAVPAIAGAIFTSYPKSASAVPASITPTYETSQTFSATENLIPVQPATLISRYSTYSFRLTNGQSESIHNFYASPSNVSSWEEDILGDDILYPDSTIRVSVDDNRESCLYDFKAIFENGTESTHYGINICDLSSYTF
jgi:hypothetical protein